ncbi:MAG: hypothetical protein ACI9HE_002383 [Planctomycetota bacterium]|jgi:hypothetical protein
MNSTLFRSKHGPLALILVLVFVGLSLAWNAPFGRVPTTDRTFILATGWTTLTLLLVVVAYVLRKYAHRGRYSPEFRLKVDYAALEQADKGIQRLRQRIDARDITSAKAIEKEAAGILKQARTHKINRAVVEPGLRGGAPWTIRILPTEPLGRVARWMHVHVFYGTAFGALLLMHSGTAPQSSFGLWLTSLSYLVLFTGLIGIYLWAKGPSWLTAREHDLSIEEASALRASLRRKRTEALESFDEPLAGDLRTLAAGALPTEERLRLLLQDFTSRVPERATDIQDAFALIAQERTVLEELRALYRVRTSFMAWKFIHIPAALLLTGLVAVHVLSIWKF